MSEAKYPVLCKDGSDSPVVLGKIKRIKSMQPKELEVEITRSLGIYMYNNFICAPRFDDHYHMWLVCII